MSWRRGLDLKLTKQDIDKVRHIDGFPIATDEDIIALSRPPYYTACPNPFIEDFIRQNGKPYDETTDDYRREPFAADVSEGKNDPIYNAHSYHTKVPYKAIMRYILHYTKPGDIIFDGFCGTGMTGVAAQMCEKPDSEFKFQLEREMPGIEWGARKAILADLSPAATFIAHNYNSPIDVVEFKREAEQLVAESEKKYGWMYETNHTINGIKQISIDGSVLRGQINCTVWSDVLICPNCSKEIVLWDVALDEDKGRVRDRFICKHCGSEHVKRDCERAQETTYDALLKENVTMAKQVPVLINYSVGNKRHEKEPDEDDLALIEKINAIDNPYWAPTEELPLGYNTEQPKRSHGISHVHQFYTRRNVILLGALRDCIFKSRLGFEYTSLLSRSTKQLRLLVSYFFHGGGGWVGTGLSGTLYIPSFSIETNALRTFKGKVLKIVNFDYAVNGNVISSCQSTTQLEAVCNNSIDYIFTDPPFGSNLNYSELSFLWESWLRVVTNSCKEAVINNSQNKSLADYQNLMEQCFCEYYRILKPGRWMTVEFHNSQNSVWNAIQEGLSRAGFIVADVRTLDKKQGSFKQVTTTTAVKQDLVISAYKPKESFVRRFMQRAGSADGVWDFVRQHLENVPIAPDKSGKLEIVAERQNYLLFDRMVAYHIMNGIPVPMNAAEFYQGLSERFLARDSMYFLADQVNEYDAKRLRMEVEDVQLSFILSDEKSAIQWLNYHLSTPQTYAEIQPQYLQALHQLSHEKMPELLDILRESFLQDDEGKWYIPNLENAADLAKLRTKKLVKEFSDEYVAGKGKLKLFRVEAVRAGFDECWKQRDYRTIVQVGNRLPEVIIQEDPALLMYYDNAASRL